MEKDIEKFDVEIPSQDNPLILAMYIDRELTKNHDIMGILNNNLNELIKAKGANIMAFYIPTDGEERIECINPVLLEKPDMDKVNKLVNDIAKHFDIGQGADEGKNG